MSRRRTAEELHALAAELRLTERQRVFCETLAVDPEGNQTKAAIAAGYTEKNAAAGASKMLNLAKIRQYMSALTEKAIETTGQRVASLREALAFATKCMDASPIDYLGDDGEVDIKRLREAPRGIVKGVEIQSTTNEEGEVFARHKLQLESGLSGAQTIIRHHEHRQTLRAKKDEPQRPINIAVINTLDPQQQQALAPLFRALLGGKPAD